MMQGGDGALAAPNRHRKKIVAGQIAAVHYFNSQKMISGDSCRRLPSSFVVALARSFRFLFKMIILAKKVFW